MRRIKKRFWAFFLLASCLPAQVFTPPPVRRPTKDADTKAFTVGADEAGCKDSVLLPRVAGCSILQCDSKTDDAVEIGTAAQADGTVQKEQVDGSSEVIYYLCPAKVDHAAVILQTETRLVKEGYTVVARGKDSDDFPLLTVAKDRQFLQIGTYSYNGQSAYVQTAVLADPEEQIDTETIEQELSKTGKVALYGLRFAKDAAEITPDLEKSLTGIAVLLSKNLNWKLSVEAVGDTESGAPSSIALAEKRAGVVTAWLAGKGIDQTRLLARASSVSDDFGKAHLQLVKQ